MKKIISLLLFLTSTFAAIAQSPSDLPNFRGVRFATGATESGRFQLRPTIIYNTSLNKFRVYENGTWKDLVAAGGGGNVTTGGMTSGFLAVASSGTNLESIANLVLTTGNTVFVTPPTLENISGSTYKFRSTFTNGNVSIESNGTGNATILAPSGSVRLTGNGATYDFNNTNLNFPSNVALFMGGTTRIYGATSITYEGTTTSFKSSDQGGTGSTGISTLGTGDGVSGNINSGDIYIRNGTPIGTGTAGNIGFHVSTVGNWQSMRRGLFFGNVVNAPTGNPASGYFTYSNIEPEGSNQVIRTSGGYIAKPLLQTKVTIAGGATLRAIGTTPQTIIAAPGAAKFIQIVAVTFSYKFGTAAYNFGASANPHLRFSSLPGGQGQALAIASINGVVSFNDKGSTFFGGFQNCPTNTSIVLGSGDSTNATTGDGDLDIVVYYTIENENP